MRILGHITLSGPGLHTQPERQVKAGWSSLSQPRLGHPPPLSALWCSPVHCLLLSRHGGIFCTENQFLRWEEKLKFYRNCAIRLDILCQIFWTCKKYPVFNYFTFCVHAFKQFLNISCSLTRYSRRTILSHQYLYISFCYSWTGQQCFVRYLIYTPMCPG